MDSATTLLAHICLMFVAARLTGELCERLGQPAVIGELLAGMLLGPFALGWIGLPSSVMVSTFGSEAAAAETVDTVYEVLAQLGAIVLLFVVGLETRLSDIVRVGPRSMIVAAGGIVVSFGLVFASSLLISEPPITALFVGTAIMATSIGITARVLADLGLLDGEEARIVLGAAIIDDILTLIALTFVSAIGRTGSVSVSEVGVIAGEAVGFAAVVALAGTQLARRWGHRLEQLRIQDAPFSVATALMLGLAVLATQMGLAAIVGAFLAGLVFSELREQYELAPQTRPLYVVLVPLFFVITGSRIDWHILLNGASIGPALVLALLAVLGKVIGCGVGALPVGRTSAAIIGVGMVPRGEVSLIVAGAGRSLGVIPDAIFSAIVVVVILTTLVVPPCLRILYRVRAGQADPLPAPGHVSAEG